VRIIVEEQYARVLNFEDVKGVTLENWNSATRPSRASAPGASWG